MSSIFDTDLRTVRHYARAKKEGIGRLGRLTRNAAAADSAEVDISQVARLRRLRAGGLDGR